jgi:hypothetical protein
MPDAARWAYVQARVMAREGARPHESAWRVLEATTEVAAFLLAARNSALSRWVERIEPGTAWGEMEANLRAAWGGLVRELAAWPPASWRAAVRWLEAAPYLSAVDDLLRTDARVERWQFDGWLRTLAEVPLADRGRWLRARDLGPLVPKDHDAPITERWSRGFEQRWPSGDEAGRGGARAFLRILRDHAAELGSTTDDAAHDLGRTLNRRFERGLRDHRGDAGAIFFFAGRRGLEGLRVRGGLLVRAALPEATEGRAWV